MYTLQASTVISIHFKTYVYQFIEKATEQFLIMVEVQGSGALNENQNPPPPFWPLYPKILFHQSIEDPLKRKHTKFQEHSQYSFFMNFYSFAVRNWS